MIACLGMLAPPATADTITLARANRPAATIVIPEKAPDRLADAAADLQTYVQRICGVELPIHRDGKTVPGTGLYIGRCEPSEDADLPDAALNPETYAIRVRNGSLFFAARYPTPVYFAVASFIEDTLGVRWFAPGDDWEYVPTGTSGELSVQQRGRVTVPDTSPRVWSSHNFGEAWTRWNFRNKAVQGEKILRRNFQNNLYRVFPPGQYAKTHPEYYPLIDGKRWIPSEGEAHWRPCESNPDVLRLTIEYARRFFDRNAWADSFSLGMDDIGHLCGCPNCRAMDPHPDSYEKREFSDRHYKFVNAVAREIARTHPDRSIGTLIYAIARKPPETVPRLEDNVFGFITEVSASWCQPGQMEADHALTREWARRCKHLSRYEYFGLGTFTPRYYPHFMAEQIKFDHSLGFEGTYDELNTFLPHTAPMIWALAKLQWDASLDIDALLSEFMDKMFGPAAPAMARYFDLLERSWNHPPPGRRGWEHRNIVIQAQAISPQAVDQGLALLDEAEAALKSEISNLKSAPALQSEISNLKSRPSTDPAVIFRRIATIRAALQYAAYAIRAYALSEELIAAPISTAADAERAMDRSLRLMQLSAEREPFWAAAMQRDDLLGCNLRGLAVKGYLQIGRVTNLERGAGLGALRALDWYAEHAPAQLPEATARLTESPPSAPADLSRAWLWAGRNHPPTLLHNANFEQRPAAATTSQPAPSPLPAAWSTYRGVGRPRFALSDHAGRKASAAVSIANAKSAGVYLQACPAQPGRRYLCTVYARTQPADTQPMSPAIDEETGGPIVDPQPRGYLAVRFQTPDGNWHPRRDLEPQVSMVPMTPGADAWQPLMLLITPPEGATRLVVMLGAKNQPEGSAIWFDDAALCQLPEQLTDQ